MLAYLIIILIFAYAFYILHKKIKQMKQGNFCGGCTKCGHNVKKNGGVK